jgi:NAD(P)-dependent dehydrogenase (short-subunit alcohol dehydrogenase family)
VSGRFGGRVVIVTGGGRGIGQATARAFAAEGALVLVTGRTRADLEATVELITADGGQAWLAQCDVTDDAAVEGTVASAVERHGRIDVLVNNAAIDDDTPFLDIDRSRWRAIVDTNLTGVFVMSQAVARHMAAAGGGVILHTASIDASGGDGPFAAYNASKAGLLGLNRTMALELARHGIRVNCVSPGFTHTDMTEKAVGPELMSYLNGSFARVPMRRLVRTDEVAQAFLFLASDHASAITGTELRVDAGLTANWFILESLPGAADPPAADLSPGRSAGSAPYGNVVVPTRRGD